MSPLAGPTDEWRARHAARIAGRQPPQPEAAKASCDSCSHRGAKIGVIDCGCTGGIVFTCDLHGRCLPKPPDKPIRGRKLTYLDGTTETIAEAIQPCPRCADRD